MITEYYVLCCLDMDLSCDPKPRLKAHMGSPISAQRQYKFILYCLMGDNSLPKLPLIPNQQKNCFHKAMAQLDRLFVTPFTPSIWVQTKKQTV